MRISSKPELLLKNSMRFMPRDSSECLNVICSLNSNLPMNCFLLFEYISDVYDQMESKSFEFDILKGVFEFFPWDFTIARCSQYFLRAYHIYKLFERNFSRIAYIYTPYAMQKGAIDIKLFQFLLCWIHRNSVCVLLNLLTIFNF